METQMPYADITSDASGIGECSLEQFARALTQGKSKRLEGGRPLLPPMPWFRNVPEITCLFWVAVFSSCKAQGGRIAGLRNRRVTQQGGKKGSQNGYVISCTFLNYANMKKEDVEAVFTCLKGS